MFARLRWLSVGLAVGAVALIELLSDTLLDPVLPFPLDTLLVVVAVLVATVAVTSFQFRRIEQLTAALERRNAELEARSAAARGLQEVGAAVDAGGRLDNVLQTVAERARALLRTDVSVIASAGASAVTTFVSPRGAVDLEAMDTVEEADRTLAGAGFTARLVTPLRRGAGRSGALAVASREPRSFDVTDVETLSTLGTAAALAIENDRLQRSQRELAVREERERIAREMHDGLAQVLGYVNTKSEAIAELVAAGQPDQARAQLAELATAARSTYVDVREAILGLSTPVSIEGGVLGALREYGLRFAEASKIAVDFAVDEAAKSVTLSPEAEAQAFRIVQEALTNVRKHAGAGRVAIRATCEGPDLVLAIQDDGRGMEANVGGPSDWPHYGLGTMAARAASAGGRVSWSNVPEGGTRVELRLPAAPARTAR